MDKIGTFKKTFDGMTVFSCGASTIHFANSDKETTDSKKCGVTAYNSSTQTAFPVLKLVTGGISSRFFGLVPVNK